MDMPRRLFLGTYTRREGHVDGKAAGIYTAELDPLRGALTITQSTTGLINPSFVALSADRKTLYAIQEIDQGTVSAFRIASDGSLTHLVTQATHGAAPCFVEVDRSGAWLLVANYSGGSIASFPILPDGAIGPAASTVVHPGPSPTYDAPHPHAIRQDLAGQFVLVPDCGMDAVYIYRFEQGQLQPHAPARVALPPASGPRHLDFHPGGTIYVANERDSTVAVLTYQAEQGQLDVVQVLSTLPDDYRDYNTVADIHLHPTGRFLYCSNRGHHSLAIYAVDQASGALVLIGHASTAGRTPRNFAITPDGTMLLAANQDSDSVASFRLDPNTGMLTPLLVNLVPSPVCICFA
ncbi:MAG: lactonase family protein [Roseiflexaceae bacterium]